MPIHALLVRVVSTARVSSSGCESSAPMMTARSKWRPRHCQAALLWRRRLRTGLVLAGGGNGTIDLSSAAISLRTAIHSGDCRWLGHLPRERLQFLMYSSLNSGQSLGIRADRTLSTGTTSIARGFFETTLATPESSILRATCRETWVFLPSSWVTLISGIVVVWEMTFLVLRTAGTFGLSQRGPLCWMSAERMIRQLWGECKHSTWGVYFLCTRGDFSFSSSHVLFLNQVWVM